MAQDEAILVDSDGIVLGTRANPLHIVIVASPVVDEDE